MKRALMSALLCGLCMSSTVFAAEIFDGVEYMTGHAGLKKQKGKLSITETELRFIDGDRVLFAIPLSTITKVAHERETDNGTPLQNALWGQRSKTEDFVNVTTESATEAEGIVFRVKRKTSPGIAAKIEFAAKNARQIVAR